MCDANALERHRPTSWSVVMEGVGELYEWPKIGVCVRYLRTVQLNKLGMLLLSVPPYRSLQMPKENQTVWQHGTAKRATLLPRSIMLLGKIGY